MEKVTIIDDVVKVHIISAQYMAMLESNINKFCVDNKIDPQRLVDIKLTENNNYHTAMIIYKTTIRRTN